MSDSIIGAECNDRSRRSFLKKCGLSAVPFVVPTAGLGAMSFAVDSTANTPLNNTQVNFVTDGLEMTPTDYLQKLYEINSDKPIERDFYGNGGATQALEEEFAAITGKERAIYLPSGTMANELAIKLLNGHNTKVIVPENSHIYRDEADAAQSVHQLRLVPVGKGQPFYDLDDLKTAIAALNKDEVFRSGLGTVVIENPVRRAEGKYVPIENIREISDYCRLNGYKMHLDGARIHLASAYTGVSVAEYAAYFDTIYISLYKYLHASGGAILCGDKTVIDQVPHQIKVHGGTVFQSWNNTSMALHYLIGIKDRWKNVRMLGDALTSELNSIEGISISELDNGTNIRNIELSNGVDAKKLAFALHEDHNIWWGRKDEEGVYKFTINESLLSRTVQAIADAWRQSVNKSRG